MNRLHHRCPRICTALAECDGSWNGTVFFHAQGMWLLYEGDTQPCMWFGLN